MSKVFVKEFKNRRDDSKFFCSLLPLFNGCTDFLFFFHVVNLSEALSSRLT